MVAVMVVDKDGDLTPQRPSALTATGMANAADYTLLADFKIAMRGDERRAVKLTVSENDDIGMNRSCSTPP